ncbi:MAG: GHKL domain-containing protein [Quinella sp. 1Q7]|nr:GHKL domain-containing protein [Quinella sp. 1Q7]
MEVANLCDTPVDFDEKNYPRTFREVHGFGMASVKNFADKYKVYVDFSQESGVFKVIMYWLS